MGDITSKEDDWLVEDTRTNSREEDRVDSSELHVHLKRRECQSHSFHVCCIDEDDLDSHLETEIGEGLGSGLDDILGLDTLGGDSENGVSHSLHLGYKGADYLDQTS